MVTLQLGDPGSECLLKFCALSLLLPLGPGPACVLLRVIWELKTGSYHRIRLFFLALEVRLPDKNNSPPS